MCPVGCPSNLPWGPQYHHFSSKYCLIPVVSFDKLIFHKTSEVQICQQPQVKEVYAGKGDVHVTKIMKIGKSQNIHWKIHHFNTVIFCQVLVKCKVVLFLLKQDYL